MNKSKLISLFLFVLILFYSFTGCGKKEEEVKSDRQKSGNSHEEHGLTDTSKFVADGKYFCPMHPTEQTNDPNARCPICKMKLSSKEQYNKDMMEKHEELDKKYQVKENAFHFEVKLSVIKSDECEEIIESALKKDGGIMGYNFDILNGVIHMYIDTTKTSKSNVEKLISDAGFDANNTKANPDAASKLPADCR